MKIVHRWLVYFQTIESILKHKHQPHSLHDGPYFQTIESILKPHLGKFNPDKVELFPDY